MEQSLQTFALNSSLPVFTSHCPGWVCYAEKTAPQVIPYLSTVKSAQQIVGALMKSLINHTSFADATTTENLLSASVDALCLDTVGKTVDALAVGSKDVFVVSIQPCFDKKLEASRRDFYHTSGNISEVDLVLSTTELWEILVSFAQEWQQQQSQQVESSTVFAAVVGEKMDVDLDTDPMPAMPSSSTTSSLALQRQQLRQHFEYVVEFMRLQQSQRQESVEGCDALEALFRQGSIQASHLLSAAERQAGSGAVTEYLFRYAAEVLYGVNLWGERDLQYKAGRNADFTELDISTYLPVGTTASSPIYNGKPLKFARAYGFRNIQSLLLKMKRGQLDIDLIEMMACPSGCNNGGGQLKNFNQLNSSSTSTPSQPETVSESKERVSNVEQTYHTLLQQQQPDANPLVQFLYAPERLQMPGSNAAIDVLHTRFHAVPKLETVAPLAAKW